MNHILTLISGVSIVIFCGCSANISRYGYEIEQTITIPECSAPIKLKAILDEKEVNKIGAIRVYDANLVSKNCDEDYSQYIKKRLMLFRC